MNNLSLCSSPVGRKKRSANANAEQKKLLTQFVRERPNLLSGKFTNNFTKESCKKLWQEAADLLNAVPGGGFKDWKHWRKTWQDLKTRTKVKEAAVRKYRTGTGGGPNMPPPALKPEEEVAVEALTKVAIEGHDNVCESLMEFNIDIENLEEEENPLPATSYSPLQIVLSPPKPFQSSSCPSLIAGCSTNDSSNKRYSKAGMLKNTIQASEYLGSIQKDYYDYKKNILDQVLQVKKEKLACLQRIAVAEERKAVAEERKAAALEKLSQTGFLGLSSF